MSIPKSLKPYIIICDDLDMAYSKAFYFHPHNVSLPPFECYLAKLRYLILGLTQPNAASIPKKLKILEV